MAKKFPLTVIVKSNALVEAKYRLSVLELRLIHMCLAQMKNGSNSSDYVIRVGDVEELAGISSGEAYRNLKNAALKLMDRRVRIFATPDGRPFENEVLVTSWVHSVLYRTDEGQLTISLSPKITPYLSRLSREFTQYRLESVSKLTSMHAIRFYELLAQWRKLGEREITFMWLRDCLGLEKSYKTSGDLKKFVIEPALNQINRHTNIKITSRSYGKTGRKITSVTIKFQEIDPSTRKSCPPPNLELFPDKWATYRKAAQNNQNIDEKLNVKS